LHSERYFPEETPMKSVKLLFIPVIGVILMSAACTGSSDLAKAPAASVAVDDQQPVMPAASQNPAPVIEPGAGVQQTTPGPASIQAGVILSPVSPTAPQSDFLLSNLTVFPNTIRLFNTANVSVTVTNNGTNAGNSTAVLNVKTDGLEGPAMIIPPSQTISLAPGESTTISFSVEVMGNGAHEVSIDGLTETLTVDSSI
jgi:hypothetical protein